MGVKYMVQYRSDNDVAWQVNIEKPNYNGDIIVLRGVSGQAAQLDYEAESADDPFNEFVPSVLTVNVYNEGTVDVDELMRAGDKDFNVKWFANGVLQWAGYLKPENMQWNFLTPPQKLAITFACGLALLDNIPYVHTDLMGTTGSLSRCPMNYIRNILFSNLDIKLPIRWTNQLQCTAFTDDVFTGGVQWSPFNEGFYTYQQGINGDQPGAAQKCGYILRGFMKAMQCRIYQSKGKWIIRRVNDVIAGSVPFKEIAANLGMMSVVQGVDSLSKRIGRLGYRFVNENAVVTVIQGIKSFKTTYTANIRTNIVPNGNYDILNSNLTVVEVLSGGIFLYWGSYDSLVVNNEASLDGRNGYCAQLTNVSGDEYFTMVSDGGILGKDGLPVDVYTLIKIINFSFTFSPGTGFAPVDGSDFIIWTSNPLQFKMILNVGATQYFLNEYGTWQTVDHWIPITVQGLKIGDIAQINFDKFQGVKVPQPPTQPQAGDTCDLQIIFKVQSGQTYSLDNVKITIDNGNDVYEAINDDNTNTSTGNTELNISTSFGGYMLSNFMTSPFKSDSECKFNDGILYSGTLTGLNSHARMRFLYKSSQVMNTDMYTDGAIWSFDEIYSVDTLLGKKFLPLNAKYYSEKDIVNIVAIESRNDNITLRENFYSSNDQQNSN
jgi:hypothetical protein